MNVKHTKKKEKYPQGVLILDLIKVSENFPFWFSAARAAAHLQVNVNSQRYYTEYIYVKNIVFI